MDFEKEIISKYPHLKEDHVFVSDTVNKAKMFYYMLKYPSEPWVSEEKRPIDDFTSQWWILSACDELIEKLGFNSATAYKENGVSWSFDGAHLSNRLVSLIKPTIGVIQ